MTKIKHQSEQAVEHYHYAIYGRRLCSDVHLPGLVEADFGARNIQFKWEVGDVFTTGSDPEQNTKRFSTNVGCDLIVSESTTGHILYWEGRCEFRLNSDGTDIRCISSKSVEFGWMVALLYSMVFSYSLHLQGIANIHAGCVGTQHGAVGMMAASGTGKSTLTAVMAAAKYPFLTDDILAVTRSESGYLAHPGYPTVSLTRESAAVVLNSERLEKYEGQFTYEKARVEIGSQWSEFSYDPIPLKTLILLDRNGKTKEFAPSLLSPIHATQAIVENTVGLPYLPKYALSSYLKFASELVAEVPVWKLSVPGNLDEMAAETPQVIGEIVSRSIS